MCIITDDIEDEEEDYEDYKLEIDYGDEIKNKSEKKMNDAHIIEKDNSRNDSDMFIDEEIDDENKNMMKIKELDNTTDKLYEKWKAIKRDDDKEDLTEKNVKILSINLLTFLHFVQNRRN